MRLYLINPSNPLVSMTSCRRWRKYRVWKPLGLMTVAALTPLGWDVTVIDENLGIPDYASLPRPDLVGLTAFTSQAPRAYRISSWFRGVGVPVVMGGIHASMRTDESRREVGSVVRGEAESVWPVVLTDHSKGALRRVYEGGLSDPAAIPLARHDLLPHGYTFGVVQTSRGCPLSCDFCSVSEFSGRRPRHRPIEAVIRELQSIPERLVLFVDDNLIGTRLEHMDRAKKLFRAMIAAKVRKEWICQATINLADDEELLELAHEAGCFGAFIGFESPSDAGLAEVGKQYNILKGADLRASVDRIHRHGISVVGSFIMGLDCDVPGIGGRIADAAIDCGIDLLNVLYLTPLPGTRLWQRMESDGRIAANDYPRDWEHYTLNIPVARYQHLSWSQLRGEMNVSWRRFYSVRGILGRVWRSLRQRRKPLATLVSSLSYRRNYETDDRTLATLDLTRGESRDCIEMGGSDGACRGPARTDRGADAPAPRNRLEARPEPGRSAVASGEVRAQ
jgi:radical SAM superfamily enzyme YgiQ (UPF0313 family)